MCLAVPAKVVELENDSAVADLHGNRVHISTLLTPEVVIGDWVLVHAGFSIQKLDPSAAADTFAILSDLRAMEQQPSVTVMPPARSRYA